MTTPCSLYLRDAQRVLLYSTVFELLLALIFLLDIVLGSPSWQIKTLFDQDGEANIPSWFSSVLFLLIALVFWLKSRQPSLHAMPAPWFFRLGGLGFTFLSLDEVASLHERITAVLKPVAAVPRFKGEHGIWIFVYALIAVALFCLCFRTVRALWQRYRRPSLWMAGGMAVMVAGGMALEAASYEFLRDGSWPRLYAAEVALEEFLEMFGSSLVLYGAMLMLIDSEPPAHAS